MNAQGACNGLHEVTGLADRIASGRPWPLGVVLGGPHAAERGSILTNPQQHDLLRIRVQESQSPFEKVLRKYAVRVETIISSVSDRGLCAPPQTQRARLRDRSHQTLPASRPQRAAAASTVRMDETPWYMRKVRVGRMKKRQYDFRPGCRDHISRLLFPQNSDRYLPFLFLDARVEPGQLATEC